MNVGMRIRLDPAGGNEVNARAALRAFSAQHPVPSPPNEFPADASDSDSSSLGDRPREKCDVGDYDLHDAFIDDDDEIVYEDDHNGDLSLAPESPNSRALPVDRPVPVLQPIDLAFFISRGEVKRYRLTPEQRAQRMRLTANAAQQARANGWAPPVMETLIDGTADGQTAPAAKNTGAAKEGKGHRECKDAKAKEVTQKSAGDSIITESNKPKPKTAETVAAAVDTGVKRPLKQQALTATGKLAKVDGTSPSVARDSESPGKKRGRSDGPDPTGKFALGRALPSAVQAEVGAVVGLLTGLFGDKKPVLTDGTLQDALQRLFQTARAHGAARLYSDIAKENRRLAIADEVWAALRPLRTTRQHLETLGHALHWDAQEQAAEARVGAAETALVTLVVGKIAMNAEKPFACSAVHEALVQWYDERALLQGAKNQLAARGRGRPLKKAVTGWAAALVKVHFPGLKKISEQTVLDALKDAQEARKEEERDAKRRKREEAAAARVASTAKRAGNALPRKITDALPPGLRGLASLKARPTVETGTPPDITMSKLTGKGMGNVGAARVRATSGKVAVPSADKVSLGKVAPKKETLAEASKEGAGIGDVCVRSTEAVVSHAGGNDSIGGRGEECHGFEVIEID